LDEYTRKRLEKIDEISDAVSYIKAKMEILDEYGSDIRSNTKDLNNLGKKVRGLEGDVEILKKDVVSIKKKTECQDEDIKLIGDKNLNFWIKILLGVVSFLTGAVMFLIQKIGII
jgi:hypothetical protein